jgi:hypothetical protein
MRVGPAFLCVAWPALAALRAGPGVFDLSPIWFEPHRHVIAAISAHNTL